MMFRKVNDHTVKCVIGENEISEMGYELDDILRDQGRASEFMKLIIDRANEEGYEISEDIRAVEATYLPNHDLVLFFSDDEAGQLMDQTVKNLLRAFGLVESMGKEQLEELFEKAKESKRELEESVSEATPTEEAFVEQKENATKEQAAEKEKAGTPTRYLLRFDNLDVTQDFCKATYAAPGKLYKNKGKFYLLADLTSLKSKQQKDFLLTAGEFAEHMMLDHNQAEYLEEHAVIMIKKDPMIVLQQM